MARRVWKLISENPLISGALLLVIGAAIVMPVLGGEDEPAPPQSQRIDIDSFTVTRSRQRRGYYSVTVRGTATRRPRIGRTIYVIAKPPRPARITELRATISAIITPADEVSRDGRWSVRFYAKEESFTVTAVEAPGCPTCSVDDIRATRFDPKRISARSKPVRVHP